jgi:hypothetical protein
MNKIRFILKGFGFNSLSEFSTSIIKPDASRLAASAALGAMRLLVAGYTGLDFVVFLAFVVLIIAEFQTGLKVSIKVKGERFKSRLFGRMILKIGTYVMIVSVLFAFASKVSMPSLLGFEINPFMWLYHSVFIAIVFQLFISWMENLGCLGYHESKTIAGFVLRKFNKWIEFDGTKDNGTE